MARKLHRTERVKRLPPSGNVDPYLVPFRDFIRRALTLAEAQDGV